MMPPPHSHSPAPEPARYPDWARDLVAGSADAKNAVARHEAWRLMREGIPARRLHRIMLIGFWPLVERFPQFLALNLLKTSHGREGAVNDARAWLARNLRVEALHADWYLDWADGVGVPRDELLDGERPPEMTAVADWCWQISHTGDLADAMAATNYAIEGVTGEWVRWVVSSERYPELFAGRDVEAAMRWLAAHASYDDMHPYEALDLIVRLVGPTPSAERARRIQRAVLRSYDLHRLALDVALDRAAAERA